LWCVKIRTNRTRKKRRATTTTTTTTANSNNIPREYVNSSGWQNLVPSHLKKSTLGSACRLGVWAFRNTPWRLAIIPSCKARAPYHLGLDCDERVPFTLGILIWAASHAQNIKQRPQMNSSFRKHLLMEAEAENTCGRA
jgi:hypothetical protein